MGQDADERLAQAIDLDPGADVVEDRDRRSLALRLERADRELDRERRAIASAGLARPLLLDPGRTGLEQVRERPVLDLGRRVAEAAQRLLVGVADATAGVHDEEDPRMRLERRAEPRLALELGTGRRQLLAGVLEDRRQQAAFADRLTALGGAGRLRDEQAKQDPVVIEEQRSRVGLDDQPALAGQVGLDRQPDRGRHPDGGQRRTRVVAA